MVLKQVITETSLNYMKKDGIKTSHHRNIIKLYEKGWY